MAFVPLTPYRQNVTDCNVVSGVVEHIFQEFDLVHLNSPVSLPYIEQAKLYYKDAEQSHWRSGGLLYYYSFLNIAKALILQKKDSLNIKPDPDRFLHGLKISNHEEEHLPDFSITIPPCLSGKRFNVFPFLYEVTLGKPWPFESSVTISLKTLMPYMYEMADELLSLYNIEPRTAAIHSLLRTNHTHVWYELITDPRLVKVLVESLKDEKTKFTHKLGLATNQEDKMDWLLAFSIPAIELNRMYIFESQRASKVDNDESHKLTKGVHETLGKFAYPRPYKLHNREGWIFVPDIEINGTKLSWHPILSDYIFSYFLSDLVRYQPSVLDPNSKDYRVLPAWCRQGAFVTLKSFLMFSTDPAKRISLIL